jgi:hypothetical protein
VLWPRDWLLGVKPATKAEPWCYEIIEKEERVPVDDGMDPRYEGSTIVKIANVPIEVPSIDIDQYRKFVLS